MKNPLAYFLMRVVNPALERLRDRLELRAIRQHNLLQLFLDKEKRYWYYVQIDKSGKWLREIEKEAGLVYTSWTMDPREAECVCYDEAVELIGRNKHVRIYNQYEFRAMSLRRLKVEVSF